MALPYQIYPTVLDAGFIHVTSWGLMIAIGFLAALFFISNPRHLL